MPKSTGDKIRALRKKANLSQADLAAATGISQGHISHIENTGDVQSIAHAKALALALGCKFPQFITDVLGN